MWEKLSKGFDILTKAMLVIACIAALYYFFVRPEQGPEVIEAPGGTATEKFIKDVVKDDKDAEHVYKEIVTIREGNTEPVYSFPSGTPQATIDAAVKADGGDKVVSEDRPEAEGGGTNIYSIHTDSSKHGIGIYAGASTDKGLDAVAVGLHIRNKRWIYQLGMTKDGGVDARVAYEVIQW